MPRKNGKQIVLDVPVEFGGVGIGKTTARLGLTISRNNLNINAADEAFCGHRLTGKVTLGQRDDAEGQGRLIEDADFEVEAVFDVKRIGITVGQVSTGLTFSLEDIDIAELAKFSKGSGRLVVYQIAAIPADAPDEHDEDREEPAGTLKAEGPWRDVPLSQLFDGALLKSLKDAKLTTVGKLADYSATENNRLTDIAGIGPGKAEKIENRLLDFWRDNPNADQPAAAQA